METACHLSLFVRDGRGVFPLRRTDVCHEIWLVDLLRLEGKQRQGGGAGLVAPLLHVFQKTTFSVLIESINFQKRDK